MDIIDVIRGQIKKFLPYGNGRFYTGKCPFCGGRLIATQYPQLWKCLDCKENGDAVSFIAKMKKISYSQANEFLQTGKMPLIPASQAEFFEMNEMACQWFQQQLKGKGGVEAREYLRKRELTEKTWTEFRLGFGGKTSSGLYKAMKKKYTDDQLRNSGLFGEGEYGLYDKFKGRVIFPITNEYGRVIGFGGRILDDTQETCKYLNSPDSKWFKKGRHLFGLSQSQNTDGNILLGEGYMDVIAMHQAGFKNAVASLGTSLTAFQARIIARKSPLCTIVYDSDGPGEKAARKAIGIFKEIGVKTQWMSMLPVKDPDEFIKGYGADKFQERIDKALKVTIDDKGNLAKEE